MRRILHCLLELRLGPVFCILMGYYLSTIQKEVSDLFLRRKTKRLFLEDILFSCLFLRLSTKVWISVVLYCHLLVRSLYVYAQQNEGLDLGLGKSSGVRVLKMIAYSL